MAEPTQVLDASALLAFLQDEPGADEVGLDSLIAAICINTEPEKRSYHHLKCVLDSSALTDLAQTR